MPLKIDISLPPLPHIPFPRLPYLRPSVSLIKRRRSFHRRKPSPHHPPTPPRPPPPKKNMDPDCAICSQPALAQCECEAKALDEAVRQAEQRMMASVFNDIRTWVRSHAQDYILSYFSMLTTRRKALHTDHIQRLTDQAYHYFHAPPRQYDILAADADLKRGIDDDWKASVQRYPEVLEYFYGLVDLSLPGDHEQGVRDPPLSALGGGKGRVRMRSRGREQGGREGAGGREGGRRRRERVATTVEGAGREGRRPGVAFAPMPGYSYVQQPY